MGELKATIKSMKSCASSLRKYNAQFSSCISELNQSESILYSMWDGEAANTFHREFIGDRLKWLSFYKLVGDYCNVLEEIVYKYELAEARNAALYGVGLSVSAIVNEVSTAEDTQDEKKSFADYIDSAMDGIDAFMGRIEQFEDKIRQAFINATDLNCVAAVGISGSLGAGLYIAGAVQIAVDADGNMALQVSPGTGVEAGASGDISPYIAVYPNSESVHSLEEGIGIEVGGSAGEGIVGGGALLFTGDDNGGNVELSGASISIGGGVEGTGAEGHVTLSKTYTIMELGNIATANWDMAYNKWKLIYNGWENIHGDNL